MEEDSTMDESNMNELDVVKDQLATYQILNGDLSKKVQEFKIALNATNKELVATRNELMSEKLKSSELRRAIMVMNGQCINFFNGYMKNLQDCIER